MRWGWLFSTDRIYQEENLRTKSTLNIFDRFLSLNRSCLNSKNTTTEGLMLTQSSSVISLFFQ